MKKAAIDRLQLPKTKERHSTVRAVKGGLLQPRRVARIDCEPVKEYDSSRDSVETSSRKRREVVKEEMEGSFR